MSKKRVDYTPPAERFPLQPSMALLVKLGSLIVHYEEFLSPTGHEFDKGAADAGLVLVMGEKRAGEWLAAARYKEYNCTVIP